MKTGTILEIKTSSAKVVLDNPKLLTGELQLIQVPVAGTQPEPNYKIGDRVLAVFTGKGYSEGFILGVIK